MVLWVFCLWFCGILAGGFFVVVFLERGVWGCVCFVLFTIKVCLEFSSLSRCSSRVFLGVSAVGTTVEFAVV